MIGKSDLQRGIDGFRARVGEEHVVQVGGAILTRRFASSNAMGCPIWNVGAYSMVSTCGDRVGDFPAAVARIDAPQARNAIQYLAAIVGPVVHAFGACEQSRIVLELAVGGERHPEGVEIPDRREWVRHGRSWVISLTAGTAIDDKKIRQVNAIFAVRATVCLLLIDSDEHRCRRHLKAVRTMYGLSQRELAKRAGVTNGPISLIEQNRVSPSVSSLKKVLDGVPMSLAEFFTLDLAASRSFSIAEELTDIGRTGLAAIGGCKPGNRAMAIMHERYRPGADTGAEMLTHQGEEGGVVISGNIELTVGGQAPVPGPGDAYYFPSTLPHRFRNVGRSPVRSSAPARRRPFEAPLPQSALHLLENYCYMKVTVAATQFACSTDRAANLAGRQRRAQAAAQGANIILVQELFETPYFCKEHAPILRWRCPSNPAVQRFQALARELNVVLPASVYERAGNVFYNSVAIIDADGGARYPIARHTFPRALAITRSSISRPAIPASKFADRVRHDWRRHLLGSMVSRVRTCHGADRRRTACSIQPPSAANRRMPSIDSRDHWQRAMQGHAAAN